ncbi:hypothetical protein HBB16_17890 [Pseudonocardia sp. MCCB 268]|nr:hypothetical protein [Pseudonocardia cytotoxica]
MIGGGDRHGGRVRLHQCGRPYRCSFPRARRLRRRLGCRRAPGATPRRPAPTRRRQPPGTRSGPPPAPPSEAHDLARRGSAATPAEDPSRARGESCGRAPPGPAAAPASDPAPAPDPAAPAPDPAAPARTPLLLRRTCAPPGPRRGARGGIPPACRGGSRQVLSIPFGSRLFNLSNT